MRLLFLRTFGLLSIPIVVAAACGGVESSSTSSGGSGGSGGKSDLCPLEQPADGAPCFVSADTQCTYGTCCPPTFQCVDGKWQGSLPPCAAPDPCPDMPPADGSPCDPCFQESPCVHDQCSAAQTSTTSICTETGSWFTVASSCECGNVTCATGEICMVTAGGPGISEECVQNPCAPGPLSCDCAGSLCGGDMFECSVADNQLHCDCPMCP